MECSLVVHVLHNLSFVAATGLPAPVFPKNIGGEGGGGVQGGTDKGQQAMMCEMNEGSKLIYSISSGGKRWYKLDMTTGYRIFNYIHE